MKVIAKMTCNYCGTEDCRIMISTGDFIDVDKNGIITTSEEPLAKVGNHISTCFSDLELENVIGSCNEEASDVSLTIEFTDGTIFNSDEEAALNYLLS